MAKSASQKFREEWMDRKWRPAMAWMYLVICIFDFIIFPILWSAIQVHYHGNITDSWNPLTLQGAGLFHLAMGAVLGVAAWSRGQEKINGVHIDKYDNGYDNYEYDNNNNNINTRRMSRRVPRTIDTEL